MNEQEWLTATDPKPKLEFLKGKASDRQLRLFACGYFRRIWHMVTEARCKKLVEISELYADVHVKRQALSGARQKATKAKVTATAWNVGDDNAWIAATRTAENYHYRDIIAAETWKRDQSKLLQCIFGNPFRPVSVDAAWRTSDVIAIAESIYQERAFDELPIMGDAVLDAGCDNSDILDHCRSEGPHVRAHLSRKG